MTKRSAKVPGGAVIGHDGSAAGIATVSLFGGAAGGESFRRLLVRWVRKKRARYVQGQAELNMINNHLYNRINYMYK